MPTKSVLLGSELTAALGEVNKKRGEEGATAGHSELSPATRETLQAAYHELKARLGTIETKIDAPSHGLKLSMGMYQASGRYFPHIWGAYIPEEAGRCSKVTTQLFVIRKEKTVSWGICPSDAALDDDKFMEAFRASLYEQKERILDLFSKGFEGGFRKRNEVISSPEEFLKSGDLTLSRVHPISPELTIDKWESLLFDDLEKLLPAYVSSVQTLRKNKFWISPPTRDDPEKRYWLIAAGPSGEMWDTFKSEGIVAISFQEFKKSFLDYSSRDEIEKVLKSASQDDTKPTHSSLACHEFAHTIKSGDFIFAKAGVTKLLGFGQVESDYIYDKSKSDYQHIRKVKWISTGPWTLPDGDRFVTKTLTDISDYKGYAEQLKEIARIGGGSSPKENLTSKDEVVEPGGGGEENAPRTTLTLEELSKLTGKSAGFFQAIKRRLEEKGQAIFYGPPGTGKTFIANSFADWFQNGAGQRAQVQFHPSYSYEDFIEGFRPGKDGGGSGFSLKAGVFKRFCEMAVANRDQKHVFIVDELNRGNLAQIFGELLYSLEYRNAEVTLPYSGLRFAVPSNVYIIGTMNSADRSIAIIDFAIRRRFDFFEFSPDASVLRAYLEKSDCNADIQKLIESFSKLNELIRERRGKHYEIGHSFWMKRGITQSTLKDIWEFNIRPLLEEYFFDDPEAVGKLAAEVWGIIDEAKVAA